MSTVDDKCGREVRRLTVDVQRPRNAAATRAAILEAARLRFVAHSYDNVGLREVAAAVGVDAALVSRYFGSKEELFNEVLACSGDGSEIFDGPVETFGVRLAGVLVSQPIKEVKMDWLLIMLRSSSSPKALELIRARTRRFQASMAEWIGGPDAELRAQVAGCLLLGAMLNSVLSGEAVLDPVGQARFAEKLAAMLQSAIA